MSFDPVNWTTNQAAELVEPLSVRGSELVRLEMHFNAVEITFEDRGIAATQTDPPSGGATVKILCSQPKLLNCRSDHLQNLVSEIYVFDSSNYGLLSSTPFLPFKQEAAAAIDIAKPKFALFVVPKVGIDLVILCNGLDIYRKPAAMTRSGR